MGMCVFRCVRVHSSMRRFVWVSSGFCSQRPHKHRGYVDALYMRSYSHTCKHTTESSSTLALFSQNPTINIVLCPTVLQRPDIGESRRYECGAHQNQPDPYGEVPQASGCVPDTGGLWYHWTTLNLTVTHWWRRILCVWAAGVVGQRAGEERSHWSRWGSHDAHETDRWCVHTQMQIMLQCIPTSCV